MARLVIAAQDIRSISLGLAENGVLQQSKDVLVSPENYLGAIGKTLASWGVSKEGIDDVLVVTGPGSFTATRTSVVIANGLAFAWQLPLATMANEERAPIDQLDLEVVASEQFATPVYDRPPHITAPKS